MPNISKYYLLCRLSNGALYVSQTKASPADAVIRTSQIANTGFDDNVASILASRGVSGWQMPQYAAGGHHPGGVRLVGELGADGPVLVAPTDRRHPVAQAGDGGHGPGSGGIGRGEPDHRRGQRPDHRRIAGGDGADRRRRGGGGRAGPRSCGGQRPRRQAGGEDRGMTAAQYIWLAEIAYKRPSGVAETLYICDGGLPPFPHDDPDRPNQAYMARLSAPPAYGYGVSADEARH